MESSIPNSSTSSSKSIALNYEMDGSNEDIDQQVLQEAGEQTISAEWSATVSALNSLDTTSSNSYINIETLKACCANPSDTLKDKEDFMIFESSSAVNTSKFNANDTKYNLECKTTAFQKKHKPISQNFSHVFENVLNDDSQMEITQNSICLNHFQKRKRLIPPNDEDFIEINNSNYSGSDNVETSMMKSPKFCFSKKKKKEKFDIPDYNFSATESVSIADDTNISKIKKNISNLPLVVNDSSNNIMEVSKTEVLTQKFSRKTIGVPDTAFDNIINDSSLISDIALNNKKTSLNDILVLNINSTPMFSKTSMSNLNDTYDVPINTNYSIVKNSISSDADVSRVKQNIVFKKPLNSSILVNDTSNNMDVSSTEIFIHKFNRKKIDITNSAFDNILNDSNMTFDTTMNNKNTSLNKNSVSNVNSTPMLSKAGVPNLNYTYDVLNNTDSTTVKESIANDGDISRVKQNNDFKIPSNLSLVNDSSNNMDVSNTEIFINKFNRKTIDVADSVFENIINDSNITLDKILNNKDTSSNKILVSNVYDIPGFSKINISNLNHTYDIPINIDSSKIDVSITADNKIVKVKQNADFIKSSTVVNDSSDNIMDLSKTEVFTHKFSRKTIDVTNSVFDNIINDSSMISNNILNNEKSMIQMPVLNVNNTPVFNKMDSSNLNHSSEAQKTQSKESIISTSSNEDLSLTNSSTGFSERRSSSRNKSKSSKNSTSIISNNDSLTLSNTTIGSLESNKSQKSQSKGSIISPSTNNESLKSTNSSTGFSERCSSPRNKSKSSKHSTSAISNNDGLTLLHTTMGSLEGNDSQISLSKRSISPSTNNESLKSTNSSTGFSERCSSPRNKSKSSKHSTSAISNNDTFTLLNTTMESLESNESQKSLSKSLINPTNNEILQSTDSLTEFSERRNLSRNKSTSSKHSLSIISNNDNSTSLNVAKGISVSSRSSRPINDNLTKLSTNMESLEGNESQKSLSKRSISSTNNESLKSTNSTTGFSERRSSSRNKSKLSKHSTSAISNNDSLTLLNTTMESLESNKSQESLSKHSISPSLYNESLKSTNSTTEISKKRSSSRNKSSLLTYKHSTSVVSNKDSTGLLNSTTGISVNDKSAKNTSQHYTSVISKNDNLTLLNATIESIENYNAQKMQSKYLKSPTFNIEASTTLNTTTGLLKQNILEQKSNCLSNVEPVTSIDIDKLTNSDCLTINNTTTLEQKVMSINQSNSSLNSSIKMSINRLEDDPNYNNKIHSLLSKQKNHSHNNIEQVIPNITDGSLVENKSSKSRVLRSSLRNNKNKSVFTKSLASKNINNLCTDSVKPSKSVVNFNNESFNSNSDNSLFWTTLPDETTSISSTQNINVNTFQTPICNKLIIAENIINTIKIMSTNKQKSTHPGAFELDDHNNGPLTRSFVTRSCNHSPSILTLVFGGQQISESTSSLTHSLSETIIDQSQIEENIKQKFKSLYKKESWITKRLYKFLIIKLQPNYNIYSVKYAEKFIKYLAMLLKQIHNDNVNLQLYTDMLRYHMARYGIIKDTFDYLGFLSDYIPMAYYKKLVPGWNLEISAVKFDPQKYYIPLMDDEEFLNYIMKHLKEA